MFILLVAAISLLIGLARGGRLIRLAQVSFRHTYVVLFSLLLQILIFSSWWSQNVGERWVPPLYLLSMLLLASWFLWNFHLPGMIFIGLGLLLNLVAIGANGGRMPASPMALERSGRIAVFDDANDPTHANSVMADEATRLRFLTDIFAIPRGWPLANVFSIGDVLIAVGAAYFLQRVLTDPAYDPLPASA